MHNLVAQEVAIEEIDVELNLTVEEIRARVAKQRSQELPVPESQEDVVEKNQEKELDPKEVPFIVE